MIRAQLLGVGLGLLLPLSLRAQQEDADPGGGIQLQVAQAEGVQRIRLGNERLELSFTIVDHQVGAVSLLDRVDGSQIELGEPFSLDLRLIAEEETSDAAEPSVETTLNASDLLASQIVRVEDIAADPEARRLVERRAGKRVIVDFAPQPDGLEAHWSLELREGAAYIRQTVSLTPLQGPAEVGVLRLFDFAAENARTAGTVDGSPVVIGDHIFLGIEHPMADNKVIDGRVVATLSRRVPIASRRSFELSSVLGVTAPGQLRREFQLGYINEERARPYALYLNYNTWYDIGYFTRYKEEDAMNVVRAYGEELVEKRGVQMDSFLFDDGWDDTSTLWEFNDGFPDEFRNVAALCEQYGASPGVWFSPWGGYGQPKDQRIEAARETNPDVETNDNGFALSGPHYYRLFRDMCLRMVRDNGIRHFKFDGTGDAGSVQPGSQFGSDFDAVIALITEIRAEQADVYINLTTGTWSSPFWFTTADSIWRGGYDHEFLGVGRQRQRWITYRDGMTWKHNVEPSPLFPINSLMLHGVILAQGARDLNTADAAELAAEIWTGFGSGTQMEELYITPSLMDDGNWDELAKAANWARGNEDTLIDTHWIGGNPIELEVYGWASWSAEKGILVLRNPSDQAQQFSADPAALFELPLGAAMSYSVNVVNGESDVETLEAGRSASFTLEPFEVLVLEAMPVE